MKQDEFLHKEPMKFILMIGTKMHCELEEVEWASTNPIGG